jgi:hypothetical protein
MLQNFQNSKLPRVLLWIVGILCALAILYSLFLGIMLARAGSVPSDLDFSTTRISEDSHFRVSYTVSTGTVPVNKMHQWTLHIETLDGQQVENAIISVDGDMPQHGHGLPTRPEVTQNLGGGNYLVEGLRFQMGGWWVMDFSITTDSLSESVHFNLMLR